MRTLYHTDNAISRRRAGSDRRKSSNHSYSGPERRITKDRRLTADKRKHKRYQVRDLTFVKLSSESEEDMGQILDISKGGLALRYLVTSEKSENFSELDIFVTGDSFTIDQIPFKTVSNLLLENRSPFSPTILKRFGVQFKELTSDQDSRLDHFISNYTLGEA